MKCFRCFFIALLWCLAVLVTAEDFFTAPQTIVDVTIDPAGNGRGMVMTGAKLFHETTQASYHDESQRDRPDLANRTQEIALLQSKFIRFGVNQIVFRSVGGGFESRHDCRQSRKSQANASTADPTSKRRVTNG
ncbi:hypothetical protein [Rhodopirellula halodulae]|uniref:hypothetical protein n=1 Tax=Rhodopirellula halodulae TaxID=2894198 RepID=UPI001E2BB370|nr:hypothetical protein [Rhodopirellula sp. JC737]MCC9658535.1 hypothetical protein [Rhodopirellula sp. JC737]